MGNRAVVTDTLFEIENLRVAYPMQTSRDLQWAVDGVSLTLKPGERLGLVGESGCGKSTLGRAALRLMPTGTRIEGVAQFEGSNIFDFSPRRLRQFRGEAVSLVFQDPMTRLDPLMSIGEHCLETLLAHQPALSRQQAREQAIATLAAVNIPAERWSQYPHEFSGGMRQRVAIALALLLNPKLIVADEPTTSLDVTVSAQILRTLTRLCAERQMALILISHDLALVAEYCDRVAVMLAGKVVEIGAADTVLQRPEHDYTRSLLQAALQIQVVDQSTTAVPKTVEQTPLLRLTAVEKHYTLEQNFLSRWLGNPHQEIKAVDGVSFELMPGDILGLVGESGCGKSTLSRTILQLVPATSGQIEFLGEDLTQLSRAALLKKRRDLQMVFQDPHACLNPMMTIGRGIGEPLLIHSIANRQDGQTKVRAMMERVGLTPVDDYYSRYPGDLSGGQQQRVAIARALITQPKLLICDEPVSMLDASIQAQVLELMLDLKAEFDLTYLFITHDLWVARYLCDRIAVMHHGKIVEIGPTETLFTQPSHPYTRSLLQAAPILSRSAL
ncbi:MAG: ABC transporter ATP-binding protein [Cyanobacteria bacterium P01_H01_bin.119]